MGLVDRLQIEREKEQGLMQQVLDAEHTLDQLRQELLRQQGAVSLLEELISGDPISSEESMVVGTTSASGKPVRSKRSTKREMIERRNLLLRELGEKGALSAKELFDSIQDEVPADFKIHHLRNVLKKFDKYFMKGEEHGVWCLTEFGETSYRTDNSDYSADSEDVSTS